MPIIEYEYTNVEGQSVVVERIYRMSDPIPNVIVVEGHNAYKIMSLTARRDRNWGAWDDGDLPPVNAHPDVLKRGRR